MDLASDLLGHDGEFAVLLAQLLELGELIIHYVGCYADALNDCASELRVVNRELLEAIVEVV